MKRATRDAINNGMIRLNGKRWQVNTDLLRRQDDGRWSNVHESQFQELQEAYVSGDLNIAPDGRASFR